MKKFDRNSIKLRPQVINLSPKCNKHKKLKDDKHFKNLLKSRHKKKVLEDEYPNENIEYHDIINSSNMPYYIDYMGDPFLRTSHYYLTKPKTFTKTYDRYTKYYINKSNKGNKGNKGNKDNNFEIIYI